MLSKSDQIGGKHWNATNYRNVVLTSMEIFDLVDIHSCANTPTNQRL